MLFRKHYNNHRSSDPYLYSIHENSATNIQKFYSIALPLWTLCFFRRLLLAVLGYTPTQAQGQGQRDTGQ